MRLRTHTIVNQLFLIQSRSKGRRPESIALKLLTIFVKCPNIYPVPTQNVNLTPELDDFVRAQVETGQFNSASEVHRAALSAMARAEEERKVRLERLRNELRIGLDDLEAGRYRAIASEEEHMQFFAGLREKAAAFDFLSSRGG